IAIVISGVNALTLTPALCALMLKDTHGQARRRDVLHRFFRWFNRSYERLSVRYLWMLKKVSARRLVTVAVLLLFIAGTWGLGTILPGGFIPTEDQGTIYVNVTTPSGSTLERTDRVMDEIQQAASRIAGVEGVSTLAGFSLFTDGAGASFGMAMISLKHWAE